MTRNAGYLEGRLLIATPNITGSSFKHSVILLCAHSDDGAMGIIVNHVLDNIHYKELFEQLDIPQHKLVDDLPVHYGGPVEVNRGFVIFQHDEKHLDDAMLKVGDIAISGSLNLLKAIADGRGPQRRMLALGYAGWSSGQLEEELEGNSWLTVPADSELIFDVNHDGKWERAALSHGVDLSKLSTTVGHA